MDNLNNRKIEMTIECKCVGLDEALEKSQQACRTFEASRGV